MITHFWRNQKGSTIVLVALMLPVLLGFTGLAFDIGNLCVVKAKMQNAVDAAVCGGGLALSTSQTQATTQANSLITSNGFNPSNASITFTQDAVKNPSNAPEINCSLTNNVSTYFMGLFGFQTVPITASAKAILQTSSAGGPFDYTLFSGSQALDLILNGAQTITGSIHSNDDLLINGSGNITGAAEGVKSVTVNGTHTIGSVVADTLNHITVNGNNTIGSTSGGASIIAMPDYSQQIHDTAATKYDTSQIFNGSVNVNGSIYVKWDCNIKWFY